MRNLADNKRGANKPIITSICDHNKQQDKSIPKETHKPRIIKTIKSEYSIRKDIIKHTPVNSIQYPATSSDSHSRNQMGLYQHQVLKEHLKSIL